MKGFLDMSYFVHEFLETDTHEGQDKYLRNSRLKTFSMLTAGNRWGKGDVACFKGCWYAYYKPVPLHLKKKQVNLLNTSISQDQANIIFNKFEEIWKGKKLFSWLITDIKYSPFPHVKFRTGVTWWFRNASQEGKFLLGRSYLWVNFDEADFSKNLSKLIEEVIEPRTWDYNGSVDAMTTPKGKRNAFVLYQKRKKENNPEYYFQRGDTRENKFINQEKLAERIKRMSPRLVMQNIEGQYVESGGMISEEQIQYCQDISTGLQIEARQGERFINAWDLARRSTWLVRITIKVSCEIPQLVSFERFKEDKDFRNPEYWPMAIAKIVQRHKDWPGKTVIDKTGLGDVVMSYIPKQVNAIGLDLGTFDRGTRVKQAIIQNGSSMINMGKVGIPWIEQITNGSTWTLQDEMRDLEEDTRGIVWDGVCALFLALYILKNNTFQNKPTAPRRVVGARGVSRYGTS